MSSLFSFHVPSSKGFNTLGVYFTVLNSVITGIVVIVIKNPIVSILFLIGLYLSLSANMMLLGLNFIALSYLLVYVGAVSMLFLFILMLINIRISEIISFTSNSIISAIIIGYILYNAAYSCLPLLIELQDNKLIPNYLVNHISKEISPNTIVNSLKQNEIYQYPYSYSRNWGVLNQIGNFFNTQGYVVFSNFWDSSISLHSHITSLGNILYTNYPILLLLTALVLLLSMVGSILITIKS